MTPYFAVLGARFRMLMQYRAAALAGFGTQFFWGLIRMMIFQAFYDSSRAPQPLNRAEVVTYIWLGQAMLMLLPWDIDRDIRAMVRSGTVAYELLRPVDLYGLWYMRAIAARTAPTLLRCLPLFAVAGLFFGLKPPPSAAAGAAWLLTTLLSVTLVYTIAGEGVARFVQPLVYTLSGMLIPLSLLPPWLQPLLNILPFRGLVDTPFRCWLGQIPLDQIAPFLAHQLVWTAVFIACGRLMLARSIRRLVVQGG
jgi:ABC-2 type transport system permease protein